MLTPSPRPNDQVRAYWDAYPPEPGFLEMNLSEMRAFVRSQTLAVCGSPKPGVAIEQVRAGGVPARVYRPQNAPRHALVWLHGGGWMFGDLDCYDSITTTLATAVPCTVISVDYRLAPEHPYPAAIDDAWNATLWAADHFEQLAVGGDSAGGNLAAAVALRCSQHDLSLAHQMLIYPLLDYLIDSRSYREFVQLYRDFAPGGIDFGSESRERIRDIWETYVPDPAQRHVPDAAPLRAESLSGLPPTTILTAEHDILRGEADTYAQRLREARVSVEVVNYEGQIHGFISMLGLMHDARDALEKAATALSASFHTRPARLPTP